MPVEVGGVADEVVAVVARFADLLAEAASVAGPRVLHAPVTTPTFNLVKVETLNTSFTISSSTTKL